MKKKLSAVLNFILLFSSISFSQISPIFTIENDRETVRIEGTNNWINFRKNGISRAAFGIVNDNFYLRNNSSGPVSFYTENGRMTLMPEGRLGLGTTNPASDALLEIDSQQDGILIPRMTNSERDLISSGNPSTGLLIYSTDSNSFWYYDSSKWVELGTGISTTTSSTPPHMNQPTLTSMGLAWTSVSTYDAHYAQNGDGAIFWRDSGSWYLSTYNNGQWFHPSDPSQGITYYSSDMNATGKIVYTRVVGNNFYVSEVTTSGTATILGPISTGHSNPKPSISLNDNGDYFVSFLKRVSGENRVHVIGNSGGTPIQLSTAGSPADQHEVSFSENGDAAVFWTQPTANSGETGLYRSEYNGSNWSAPPGLQNPLDVNETFIGDLALESLDNSIDGQFLLVYDAHSFNNSNDPLIKHKLLEKRAGTWQMHNFITSNLISDYENIYSDVAGSMSDNGKSIYTYTGEDQFELEEFSGLRKYDVSVGNWVTIPIPNLEREPSLFRANDISNNEEIILSEFEYCGNDKFYLSLDAFNFTYLPNVNEGIGIEGTDVFNGDVNVNNSGSFLTTWIQNDKLMYMIN